MSYYQNLVRRMRTDATLARGIRFHGGDVNVALTLEKKVDATLDEIERAWGRARRIEAEEALADIELEMP